MASEASPVVRFGGFELDRRSGELLRGGRRLHLTPQAFQLLLLLVDRAGEVVMRDEIRRSLWGDTFVDADTAMNVCVSQVRATLNDSAQAPRFIETLPRRGYRFVAPVERVNAMVAETVRAVEPDAPAVVRPAARLAPRAAAALLVAGWVALLAATPASSLLDRAYPSITNLEALKKFEMGRSGLEDGSPAELKNRVRHFETALKLAPEFPEAYAGLAEAKLILAGYRAEEPQPAYAAAKAAAARALQMDDRLADAHAVYASAVLLFDWNWTEAEAHFGRAIELGGSPRIHHWYARFLTAAGRHAEAIEQARLVASLRPGSPSAWTYAGVAAFYAGDTGRAVEDCGRAIELMPEFEPAARCLAAAREPSHATPAVPDLYLTSVTAAVRDGQHAVALRRLQEAANRHSDALIFAAVQPAFREIRGDARFRSILDRLGAPTSANASR